MANNVPALKTEMITMLQNTANLDASTKLDIRNMVVSAYQGEWLARVQSGTADTPANRTAFAVDKWFQFLSDIVKAERNRIAHAAVAPSVGVE